VCCAIIEANGPIDQSRRKIYKIEEMKAISSSKKNHGTWGDALTTD
jgi:hypothetical protein